MKKQHLISIAIVVALLLIVYFSMTNNRIHPPREQWLVEHGDVIARNKNPNEFCLECHNKKFGHTKENFCNDCHKNSGVKLVK